MKLRSLIIPSILLIQVASAQNTTPTYTSTQEPVAAPVTQASAVPAATTGDTSAAPGTSTRTAIIDYKSVYEASTLEEEVKMAAERFELTASQQEMWLTAATDRRATEQKAREMLEKAQSYEKEGVYRGLRASQNTFHETITGYLTPTQKQALETDRLILQEKQRRLAKLPPPPPAPVDTVAPVDSSAVKAVETEKAGKKSKKKKKSVTQ